MAKSGKKSGGGKRDTRAGGKGMGYARLSSVNYAKGAVNLFGDDKKASLTALKIYTDERTPYERSLKPAEPVILMDIFGNKTTKKFALAGLFTLADAEKNRYLVKQLVSNKKYKLLFGVTPRDDPEYRADRRRVKALLKGAHTEAELAALPLHEMLKKIPRTKANLPPGSKVKTSDSSAAVSLDGVEIRVRDDPGPTKTVNLPMGAIVGAATPGVTTFETTSLTSGAPEVVTDVGKTLVPK